MRLPEGDAGNRGRGVVPDPGQLLQGFELFWDPAIVVADHHSRRVPKGSRAAVVAESAPRGENVSLPRGCQRTQRWKFLEELAIARDHHRDPRLLKHDLGDQDAVRGLGLAPRQRTLMTVVPGKQPDP